ncbi:hypothetical protein [Olsenella sp. An270]|uniref:hypothetical protein n=1 Tax=Olsenella sp. An270 TaxID=1965615 RepID=UPI000B3A52EA|nr:hypothetical protein [Olsenella sp. An270]OUO60385.1 hypothetical protein B5F73_03570 [Olsenella sp. An270]
MATIRSVPARWCRMRRSLGCVAACGESSLRTRGIRGLVTVEGRSFDAFCCLGFCCFGAFGSFDALGAADGALRGACAFFPRFRGVGLLFLSAATV